MALVPLVIFVFVLLLLAKVAASPAGTLVGEILPWLILIVAIGGALIGGGALLYQMNKKQEAEDRAAQRKAERDYDEALLKERPFLPVDQFIPKLAEVLSEIVAEERLPPPPTELITYLFKTFAWQYEADLFKGHLTSYDLPLLKDIDGTVASYLERFTKAAISCFKALPPIPPLAPFRVPFHMAVPNWPSLKWELGRLYMPHHQIGHERHVRDMERWRDEAKGEQKRFWAKQVKEAEKQALLDYGWYTSVSYARVPFGFEPRARSAHHLIVAPTDYGKTQTLERLILNDLDQDDPPGMVVIDSKGDMIKRLSRLDVFHPSTGRLKDRLIIIDPRDGPALNVFATTSSDPDIASRTTAELGYFFRSLLGSEVTSTMAGVFQPLAQLLSLVPRANLNTLLEAVDDIKQFRPYIAQLSPTMRNFFERDFVKITGRETVAALKRRIYGVILASAYFEKMFNARTNCLDLTRALNEGKIVLISTERNALQDLSPIFGRYWIFRVISAALQRATQRERRQAYLYIDEAGPYVDEKAEELFSTLRSYGLGAIMAFQQFDQVPPAYQRTIMANTAIKMIGGTSMYDAKTFAGEMRTTPDFIFNHSCDVGDRPKETRFATYVKNAGMQQAITLEVPIGELDRRPRMGDREYAYLRKRNRDALAEENIEDAVFEEEIVVERSQRPRAPRLALPPPAGTKRKPSDDIDLSPADDDDW